MTPEMQEALYQLSVCYDPDPSAVFRKTAEVVSAIYGGTMAMINLCDDDCMTVREVVNPIPLFAGVTSLPMNKTACLYAIRTAQPLLVKDFEHDPRFHNHLARRVGLRRYLGVPICNMHGDPVGTLCFLDEKLGDTLGEEDIRFLSLLATRVSAELERERLIGARVEEHRAMAERLSELNAQMEATAEEKRRFVAMVMHDLRHPLTTLRTVLYLLNNEQDPAERASYLNLIENRVDALANLLDGLMQYNEIEAGRIRLNIAQTDIAALITDCVEGFAPAFIGGDVRFECAIDPDLGVSETDHAKLTHILLNLLSNALKFTPQGTISVHAHRHGDAHWILEVADTGVGMSADEKERVFEEFYSTSTVNKNEERGSGLGLAIVRQMCHAMQATLRLESAPGAGTSFRIVFPRTLVV